MAGLLPAKKDGRATAKPAGEEGYKKASKARGSSDAQVPGSGTCLTPQQLNSQRQNRRRAKEKAAEKAAMMTRSQPAVGLAAGPVVAGSVGGAAAQTPVIRAKGAAKAKAAPQPGRILEAVADFWERKKAKAKAKAAASGDG